MPYSFEYKHLRIPQELDRRRKIPESEHEQIRKLYHKEKLSLRTIARIYSVSHRLIQFIIHPEKAQKNAKQFAERRKDGRYYNPKKQKEAIKRTRQYKKTIISKLIK